MQNSKLAALLSIIATVVTILVIFFINVGTGLFFEYLLVSVFAFLGWIKFSYKTQTNKQTIAPYILCIILILCLNVFRYYAGFTNLLSTHYSNLFVPGFTISYIPWFLLFVCLPVSLLLIGGYFLSRLTTVGSYFAWWGFIYCILEAVIEFKVELGNINIFSHFYFLGTLTGMALFFLAVTGLLKLIKPKEQNILSANVPAELRKREINLWSILFISLTAVYAVTLYTQAGLLPVGVIFGSMMGGMIGWRKTTARFSADPYKVVPLYLLLLALFYIHVGEETLTDFSAKIAGISGVAWSDKDYNYFIAFMGPIIWVYAAYSLWKRQPFGNFILWFMIVGMILGEPTHLLVFPVVRMFQEGVGYGYFSGMYTALFPIIPAILALTVIIKEYKQRNIPVIDAK